MKTINEIIYQRLIQIVPEILEPDFTYKKLEAENFMPLSVDLLYREGNSLRIALAHNYKHPSGDLIPDPDMEVHVDPDHQMATALSYQDAYGYTTATPEPGKVNPETMKQLNRFLAQWLQNLLFQGHQ